ncbi:hypothetical protein BCR34DRAFT_587062 [Clohesyomyces aquaticus]|uniref:Heterokaryon incompatibility domain-containing protein n=1 Tax=Clohesyomyces aquaticus TaxID=1231657 RepID=A0A1Y1ZRZ2_9PLEO|nr:hypothetical protein BCR34DRAFT_587062 [Clohesyomyces aquaticus]
MVDLEDTRGLRPDYKKTVEQVFQDATLEILMKYKATEWYYNLQTLSYSKTGLRASPSWGFDFSFYTRAFAEAMQRNLPADASPWSSGTYMWWDSVQNLLSTYGTIVDSVTELCCRDSEGKNTFSREYGDGIDDADILNGQCLPVHAIITPPERMPEPIKKIWDALLRENTATFDFIVRAQVLHDKASEVAKWWAPNGIEPLWRTLLANNLASDMSPTELPEKLDVLSGKKAVPASYRDADNHDMPSSWRAQEDYQINQQIFRRIKYAQPLLKDIRAVVRPFNQTMRRVLFKTQHGLCGVGMDSIALGDELAMLFQESGTPIPFILRKTRRQRYIIVIIGSIAENWLELCNARGLRERTVITIE